MSIEEVENFYPRIVRAAGAKDLGRDSVRGVEAGNDVSVEELLCRGVTTDRVIDD